MAFDKLHRYIFDQANVRGELVRLQETYESMLDANDYPPVIKTLLGELLVATSLMTATLKFDGEISIQLQGDGALNYAVINGAVADSTRNQQLRGVARWDETLEELPTTFAELFVKGLMVITITPSKGERYQGMVALDKPSLAECVETYFVQSEQLATKVILRTKSDGPKPKACGMLLQILPTSSEITQLEDTEFEHISQLTDTIKDEELFELPTEDILYRLYHQEKVELFAPQSVVFKCSCSRQRSATALTGVAKAELLDIIAKEGSVKLNCQYCHAVYHFDTIDVESIHAGTYDQEQGLQ